MQFWRFSIHSQRISSRTSALFSDGLSREVERIEALGLREARQPNVPLHIAPLAINALQFAQAQQIARVIGAILRRFHGDLFILARECGKLQGFEMMAQQHLGRDDRRRWVSWDMVMPAPPLQENGALAGDEAKIGARIGCPTVAAGRYG